MKRVWIGVFAIVMVCVMGLITMSTRTPEVDATVGTATQPTLEQNPLAPEQPTFANEAGTSIVRMFAALAIVLACIYGCVFLIKRFGPNRTGRAGGKKMLEMVDSISVGPKKMIAVVRVGERAVVVGITDSQMTALSELDKDELPNMIPERAVESSAKKQSFANLFDIVWQGPVKTPKMTSTQSTTVA